MWIIIKYKKKEFSILQKEILNLTNKNSEIYIPKVKISYCINNKLLYKSKTLLDDYLFCYSSFFSSNNFINLLNNLKGLKYVLTETLNNQSEIKNFIERCKKNEVNGFLTQDFFHEVSKKERRFISGPFKNIIFSILNKDKNKIQIKIGGLKATVKNNAEYLYQ